VFQEELAESLAVADSIVVASVFHKTTDAIPERERLDTAAVVQTLRHMGRPAVQIADADTIVTKVVPELKRGDVVAILSNGGFGGIYEKLPSKLRQARGVTA
jgi:UDP-N-acetylmuramate: L-alanyl-gamma-D-glutamyl-meso-diaminopimelate ligase